MIMPRQAGFSSTTTGETIMPNQYFMQVT